MNDHLRPVRIDPAQQPLFAVPEQDPTGTGYRATVAAAAVRITYRQIDHWARTGLVTPSIRAASGSGSTRLYSFRDILVLHVVKRLLGTGLGLPSIRTAVATLRDRGVDDLASITLMSDGISVYECASDDEVVDLVRAGQGVFGIAIGPVLSDVHEHLEGVPPERLDADPDDPPAGVGRRLHRVG